MYQLEYTSNCLGTPLAKHDKMNIQITLLIAGLMLSPLTSFANPNEVMEWIKPTDPSYLSHPIEERGFVEVPLDYDQPNSPSLKIAYRVLPVMKVHTGGVTYQSAQSFESRKKPYLFIINGGPGASSAHLRKLNFVYDSNPPTDRLIEFTQHFRVVLIDQRGTSGQSSSLDLENPKIDAQKIVDYFGPRPVTLDHAAVIKKVVKKDEPFYIVAQSYGGLIGANYLVEMQRDSKIPKPAVMALTSPGIQTAEDAFARQTERRKAQRDLALQLKKAYPEIVNLMAQLRARIHQVDPTSTVADSLATTLGRPAVDWKADFVERVKKMIAMNEEELRTELKGEFATIELFNHILSSVIITPGYTDRTIYLAVKDIMPLEDWMPDELRNYHNGRADMEWKNQFLDQMDLHPPKQPKMASMEEIKAAVAKSKVVLTGSVDDPLIPVGVMRLLFKDVGSSQTKYLEFRNGGHSAAFVAPNCEELLVKGFGIKEVK